MSNNMSDCKATPLCTLKELLDIITAPSGGFTMEPSDSYNEVYPNLFVGDESIAKNYAGLKRLGITHVVNAAMGRDPLYYVNTNEKYYSRTGIKFHGVPVIDHDSVQLKPYFEESAKFIDLASAENGRVLVNCRVGMSRSAAVVLAYLMLYKKMRLPDAVRHMRQRREICPNDGFLLQLIELYDKLHHDGHFN